MAVKTYGWTSKVYPFGTALAADGAPTKLLLLSDLQPGNLERIVIKITFGRRVAGELQYLSLVSLEGMLDVDGNTIINTTGPFQVTPDALSPSQPTPPPGFLDLRNQEVSVVSVAPDTPAEWDVIFKTEIYADENTLDNISRTELVDFFLYRDEERNENIISFTRLQTQATTTSRQRRRQETRTRQRRITGQRGREFFGLPEQFPERRDEIPTRYDSRITETDEGTVIPEGSPNTGSSLIVQSGVQIQIFTKSSGTPLQIAPDGRLEGINVATIVTDDRGFARARIPPGSYDIRFTGAQFDQRDWLIGDNALAIGVSEEISRFGSLTSDTVKSADFKHLQATYGQVSWISHFIPEDFTFARSEFREESSDPNFIYGDFGNIPNSAFARQAFGRCFKGNSFVSYIGIGMDPTQEIEDPGGGEVPNPLITDFQCYKQADGTACNTDEAVNRMTWTPNLDVVDDDHDLEIYRYMSSEGVNTNVPDATLDQGGYSVVGAATAHAALASVSDASYVETSVAEDSLEVSLANPPADPIIHKFHIVRFRVRFNNATPPINDGMNISLKQGTTQLATFFQLLTSSFVQYEFILTEEEAEAITDYNDLRISFTSTSDISTHGGDLQVSYSILELTNVATLLTTIGTPASTTLFDDIDPDFVVNSSGQQFSFPDATISQGSWTPQGAATLHECVDEDPPDWDVTRIRAQSQSTCELALATLVDPGVHTGHSFKVLVKGDLVNATIEIMLYQGAAQIATSGTRFLFTEYGPVIKPLSVAQAASITNYADLRVKLLAKPIEGGQAFGPAIYVTQVKMQVPLVPGATRTFCYHYRLIDPAVVDEGSCLIVLEGLEC